VEGQSPAWLDCGERPLRTAALATRNVADFADCGIEFINPRVSD